MANGHIEIHDPFSNGAKMERSTGGDDDDAARKSDTASMEETVEFRLMMAYAQRRRGTHADRNSRTEAKGDADSDRKSSTQTPPEKTEREVKEKKKKKKVWKRLFTCVRPRAEDEEVEQTLQTRHMIHEEEDRMCSVSVGEPQDEDELEDAAAQLTQIADDIPFTRPPYEADTTDDLERVIGLLLRETGDRLNEQQELDNLSIAREIFWNYSFYRNVITTLLMRMGLMTSDPDSPGPQASPKAQIAVACEATSRLTVLDTQPMSRLLGYGARFLREHYSSWVQEQGGYEAAFYSDDEDA